MAERAQAAVLTVGGLVAVVGMFAPWLTVGPTSWSSFDLRNLVADLGFTESSFFDYAVTLWALVPALLAVSILAAWLAHLVTSGVFGTLGAVYAGVVALAVTQAPDIALFDMEWGIPATLVGAAAVLIASVWGFVLAAASRGENPVESAD